MTQSLINRNQINLKPNSKELLGTRSLVLTTTTFAIIIATPYLEAVDSAFLPRIPHCSCLLGKFRDLKLHHSPICTVLTWNLEQTAIGPLQRISNISL